MPSKQKIKKKKVGSSSSSPARPSVDRKVIARLNQLLENIPPARLKNELLYVFLIFLEHQHEALPINFREMLADYYSLFDFLDVAAESERQLN